ncbi:MAG: hypothetical protein H6671_05890 [Anaerolineaceae bacterium]|nr:hypothetical protein [Anaerolineaceae bacterium]
MKVIFNVISEMTVRSIVAGAISGALFGMVFVVSIPPRGLETFLVSLAIAGLVGMISGGSAGLVCGLVIGIMVGFLLRFVYQPSSGRQMNYWIIAIMSGLASCLLVLMLLDKWFFWFRLIPAIIAGVANAYNGWRYARSVVADTSTPQPA